MKTSFDESRVFAQSHARVARPEKHGEEWVKVMVARRPDEAKIKSTHGTDKIEGKETERRLQTERTFRRTSPLHNISRR